MTHPDFSEPQTALKSILDATIPLIESHDKYEVQVKNLIEAAGLVAGLNSDHEMCARMNMLYNEVSEYFQRKSGKGNA